MGGKASKIKGSNFERELAKTLSEIFKGSFIRSPSSGAYVGGKNAFRKNALSEGQIKNAKGDLVPPDFMNRLTIECKNYASFKFHQIMMPGYCAQLDNWISQTLDCIDPGDIWFVCFKITRLGWFVAVPIGNDYVFGNHCIYQGEYAKVYVTELKTFFETNKDKILRDSV